MTTLYSALWELWEALDEQLAGVSFPQDFGNPEPVRFHFGWPGQHDGYECVTLVGALANPSDDKWWTMGPGTKDETFAFLVEVETAIPGRNSRQVRQRLRDLVQPVDEEFRTVQGKPRRAETVPGSQWWTVASRRPLIIETESGARGECELVITARVVR